MTSHDKIYVGWLIAMERLFQRVGNNEQRSLMLTIQKHETHYIHSWNGVPFARTDFGTDDNPYARIEQAEIRTP